MRRSLAVVFSGVLLSGVLLAEKCPKPPANPEQCPKIEADGCVTGGFSNGVCTVPLDYFNNYQGCKGDHDPIQIAVGDYLVITNASGSIQKEFSVGSFTKYKKSSGAKCDQSLAVAPAKPFSEAKIQKLMNSHKLEAKIEGCYKVNLTLKQDDPDHPGHSCAIDPHIIIRGTRPTALHEEKK
jgi:hypothetical protein